MNQQFKIPATVFGISSTFMIEQAYTCLQKAEHLFAELSAKDYTEELSLFWESLSDLFKLSVQKNHFALACEWLGNCWECKILSISAGIQSPSPGFSLDLSCH